MSILRTALVAAVLATQNPVGKVVETLKRMQTQLETEQKEDAEAYEKLTCWCDTNKAEKTAAVATAEKSIGTLTATIETLTAKSAELQSLLVKVKKATAKNQEALDSATSLREKEAGEFSAEERELMGSLDSVGSAIDAVKAQHAGTESLIQIKAGVRAALTRGTAHLSAKQRSSLHEALKQPAGFNSYNSRSGAIFGIMGQMKETFTTDLSQARADEGRATADYEALAAAKGGEISAQKKMTVEKTQELATTDEDLASAKHDKELTIKQLTADQEFLVDLGERCEKSGEEFQQRRKDRATEISAVGEALKILTDDSARDNFETSLSFVQVDSAQKRHRAAAVLSSAARRTHSQMLMEVASAAKLMNFNKIIGMVDSMVTDLKKQMDEEVKHKDFCSKELYENGVSQKDTKATIADLEATIADLEADIETLGVEIDELLKQDMEMKVQVKKASEDRSAENKVFQQTVADQRVTQELLTKAMKKLQAVYATPEKENAPAPAPEAFLQRRARRVAQPEEKTYELNSSGGGVLSMMAEIIKESATMESEAQAAEQDAQNSYQSFVADTAKSIEAGQRTIANKQEEKAGKEASRVAAKASHKGSNKELVDLKKYNSQLHSSCDYVLANFAMRQEARAAEMDALGQAKAILSGA
jgi:hypothetical protein